MIPEPLPILAVVPARGGSKAVRGKNLQLIEGKPLLVRTLETIVASGQCARIVVSTEDPEIAAVARVRGFDVVDRPAVLSGDDVPILPVVRHAAKELGWRGIVAVFQPTCPLLTPGTVQRVIGDFCASTADWAITGVRTGHLLWHKGQPLTPRLNRQAVLESDHCPIGEVGAVALYRPGALEGPGRGIVIPIVAAEGLDIDSPADLFAARSTLAQRRILIEVAVGKQIGSGHFYRALRLVEGLTHHEVGITMRSSWEPWAVDALEERGLYVDPSVDREFVDGTDLHILDCLDTTTEQVARWKAAGKLVATFEDEGDGALYADLVVNELLANRHQNRKALCGPDYTVLRPEFLAAPPRAITERLGHVLVTFGGTDPSGLNVRFASLLRNYGARVMAGPGACTDGLEDQLLDVTMAEAMSEADLVITSQGRTQYEAAALGVPTITVAANERESRHVRCPGHLHLGLHAAVSDRHVMGVVARLGDPGLRREMGDTARRAVDGRGLERIVYRLDGLLRGLFP